MADPFAALSEPVRVVVNDRMQRNYVYFLTEPVAEHFYPGFEPNLRTNLPG